MFDLPRLRRGVEREHAVARPRRRHELQRIVVDRAQRNVDRQRSAADRTVDRLNRHGVDAGDKVLIGPLQQKRLQPPAVQRLARPGVVGLLAGRHMRPDDFDAVDPDDRAVVDEDLHFQLARDVLRQFDRELFPQKHADVVVLHIIQHGLIQRVTHADRRRAGEPGAVFDEIGHTPGVGRAGGLAQSLAIAPRCAQFDELLLQDFVRTEAGRTPTAGQVVVERRMDQLDRRSLAVGRHGPGRTDAVIDRVDTSAGGGPQADFLAVVVERAGGFVTEVFAELAEGRDAERLQQVFGVSGNHNHLARRDRAAGGKHIVDPVVKKPAGDVDRVVVRVDEFNELGQLRVVFGVVVDFVDDDADDVGRLEADAVRRAGRGRNESSRFAGVRAVGR